MSEESEFSQSRPFGWIQWFCAIEDHQFLCEVNEQFIMQPHNLYGLDRKIVNYNSALKMILRDTSPRDDEMQSAKFLETYQEAAELYALVHARYIRSPEGIAIMRERYLAGKFGKCPRVMCEKQHVVPIGISDDSKIARVKIYCPRCKDVYCSSRSSGSDGSCFGPSFPHLLFMTYPDILPEFEQSAYFPAIFGFRIQEEQPEPKCRIQRGAKTEVSLDKSCKKEVGTSTQTRNDRKIRNK